MRVFSGNSLCTQSTVQFKGVPSHNVRCFGGVFSTALRVQLSSDCAIISVGPQTSLPPRCIRFSKFVCPSTPWKEVGIGLVAAKFRKIRAPIKIKSALPLPPPKPPSKTRNFMDMGFPAERTHFFQASIKLAQPFPARNCGHEFYGHEDFSEKYLAS